MVLLFATAACGDSRPKETVASMPVSKSPLHDSARARSDRAFARRPDTFLLHVDSQRTVGVRDAPLTVIFVGQLECAGCTDAVRDLLPTLRREYVVPGRIKLEYRSARAPDTNYNARFAVHAAYCAALADAFWPMIDALAASREEWAHLADPQPRFDSLAVRLGAKPAQQHKCTEQALMSHTIQLDEERVASAGIRILPTLIVGSEAISGDLSLRRVRMVIDAALAKKR